MLKRADMESFLRKIDRRYLFSELQCIYLGDSCWFLQLVAK